MHVNPLLSTNFSSVNRLATALQQPGGHIHRWAHALSRRQFLGTAASATGVMLGASLVASAWPICCADPVPIPGGLEILGDGTIYHINLPGYPPIGSPNPATNDPSLITDFNGHIGLAYVQGRGTHTDKKTGVRRNLPFEVDLRFMKGEFIGADGRRHHGAFALH
jgi:hypothetical protein